VSVFIVAAALVAALAITAILVVAGMLSRRVSDPGRREVEADLVADAEKGFFDLAAWKALPRERFSVSSPMGYELACEWLCPPGTRPPAGAGAEPSRPLVVIAHGHSWDRAGSAKYVGIFLDLGWDALIYDHRGCGDSGGAGTTMGHYESRDLGAVIQAARARVGPATPIAAMGESMGAATVLIYASRAPEKLAFVIADCGFSDLLSLLAFRLKADYRLPAFPFLALARLLTRLRLGYDWRAVSPRREIEEAGGLPGLPLLIFHGEADDYVPPVMARELASVKREPVELVLVPGAGHAMSWETDREAYAERVRAFIGRHLPAAAAPD